MRRYLHNLIFIAFLIWATPAWAVSSAGLIYSPPAQVNPTIVHVVDTGDPINLSYSTDQDVTILHAHRSLSHQNREYFGWAKRQGGRRGVEPLKCPRQ